MRAGDDPFGLDGCRIGLDLIVIGVVVAVGDESVMRGRTVREVIATVRVSEKIWISALGPIFAFGHPQMGPMNYRGRPPVAVRREYDDVTWPVESFVFVLASDILRYDARSVDRVLVYVPIGIHDEYEVARHNLVLHTIALDSDQWWPHPAHSEKQRCDNEDNQHTECDFPDEDDAEPVGFPDPTQRVDAPLVVIPRTIIVGATTHRTVILAVGASTSRSEIAPARLCLCPVSECIVPRLDPAGVAKRLANRGFNVTPSAARRLAAASDPDAAIADTIENANPDAFTVSDADIPRRWQDTTNSTPTGSTEESTEGAVSANDVPPETKGGATAITITGDVTGSSTGTGEYSDLVKLFRDRYERLSELVRGRVSHRSARALENARGGAEVGMIGLVNDVRSTRNGHWLIELEDPTGAFPALVLGDDELAERVPELLYDEVIGVAGRLSDDSGMIFAESIHVPDVPRTNSPSTADRHVEAALISDIHVGSEEFLHEAWSAFAEWLHTEEAAAIEYLLIAGDMVEGVGVYPGQDADLAIIDVYEQYEQFSEELKAVPGDLEVIMIPGNHDAVRLAEPQPAFEDEIGDVLAAHDATIVSNPSTVTIESVDILLYHGASLDTVIAETPREDVAYETPHGAMTQLLKKRHLAPPYGSGVRIAPEERDYLVIDSVPDVFHSGHVHTVGVGTYHGVRIVNSGCWQAQTDFQRRNNLDPHPGQAPILDLQSLDLTIRKFV